MYNPSFSILVANACTQDPIIPRATAISDLTALGETFDGENFDWGLVRKYQLLNHCIRSAYERRTPTSGKILAHALSQITCFRETIGVRLCVFKVGVSSNPIIRYTSYLEKGFTDMWILTKSYSVDQIHMLEAACISHFSRHVGCRNQHDSGGEGALNKKDPPRPPFFLYVTGGRADRKEMRG